MVLYEKDSHPIFMEPMKIQTSGEMCRAYNKLMERGIKVTKHILDNKASYEYLQAIKCNEILNEKVPPNIHRRNMAEKASSMSRAHFQAILMGVDNTFPMHLRDHLLPQAENKLNMLHPMNIAPTISAYAYMNGQHYFNKMP